MSAKNEMDGGLPTTLDVSPSLQASIHPAYFETQFEPLMAYDDWPKNFAIVTAYATTGETWTKGENEIADALLEAELRKQSIWMYRLTGYSPNSEHAEAGWAAAISFDSAVKLGQQFRQDAIYYVSDDTLFVSLCDHRRSPVFVGSFRTRLHFRKSV